MFKLLITLVVVVAIVGGLWYSGWLSKILPVISTMHSEAPAPGQTQATTSAPAPVVQAPAPVNDLPTATNDASDQALAQDAAAIDVQMQGLSSDNANSSGSLNDKPVSQEY